MHEEDAGISLGQLLREARESKGLSIEGAAAELYISPAIIKLIESDEYDLNAPDAVFMRGYIRSYARLVGVTEDEVGDTFKDLGVVPEVEEAPPAPKKIDVKEASSKDKSIKLITNCIIVVLVVLMLIWWYSHFVSSNKDIQPPEAISAESVVPAMPVQSAISAIQPKPVTKPDDSAVQSTPATPAIETPSPTTPSNEVAPAQSSDTDITTPAPDDQAQSQPKSATDDDVVDNKDENSNNTWVDPDTVNKQ